MEKKMSSDKELIAGLLHGCKWSLNSFYQIYGPQLRRYIFTKVSSQEDVEEILQDTMISAIDSLALFSQRSSFFSWLCGIAKHEIADHFRRRQIKTIVFSRLPAVEKFVSKALEPDAKMMRAEYERRVKRALSVLLPQYKEILELKYMDGLSVEEIAQKMGMTFKAVESALVRARRAFAVAYEKE